jgi:hypothetical protein
VHWRRAAISPRRLAYQWFYKRDFDEYIFDGHQVCIRKQGRSRRNEEVMDEYFFQENKRLVKQETGQEGFLSTIVEYVERYLENLNRIFFLSLQKGVSKNGFSQLFFFLKISLLLLCCVVSLCFILSLPHKTPSRIRSATLMRFRPYSRVLYKSMLDDEKKKKYVRKSQQKILIDLSQRLSQVKTYWIVGKDK